MFFSGVPAVKGLNFCATDSCGATEKIVNVGARSKSSSRAGPEQLSFPNCGRKVTNNSNLINRLGFAALPPSFRHTVIALLRR